jgi:hypothetical protein
MRADREGQGQSVLRRESLDADHRDQSDSVASSRLLFLLMAKPEPRPPQRNLLSFFDGGRRKGAEETPSQQSPAPERQSGDENRGSDSSSKGRLQRRDGSNDDVQIVLESSDDSSSTATNKKRRVCMQDNPDDLDPSRPPKNKKQQPKKLFPLFAPKERPEPSGFIDLTQSPPRRDVPNDSFITISDSPTSSAWKSFSSLSKSSKKKKPQLPAPWPAPGEQHVNYVPPSSPSTRTDHRFRPESRSVPSADSRPGFVSSLTLTRPYTSPMSLTRNSASCPLPDDLGPPLVASLYIPLTKSMNPSPRGDPCDVMWTTKYAPTSAKEVLGSVSQRSSCTLRDWLRELAIGRTFLITVFILF